MSHASDDGFFLGEAMSDRSHFDAGARGYDRGFGSVSPTFIPTLLRLAHLDAGHRVLDVATGTGIAAEAAARIVGPTGQVVASDLSIPILEQARERLGGLANISFAHENGEALNYPEGSFDTVLCAMGLMLFPDPARGLAEFRRVLRDGGRVAISVGTTSARSFVARISTAIGRHAPSKAPAAARFFSLGDAGQLRMLLEAANFHAVETATQTHRFRFASFDAYFDPIDAGIGNVGVEYASLPGAVRQAVRDDVRRELEGAGAAGSSIEVEVEILFGCGRK
jgi:ubiquinone/menaquinone biosynthesis C-methylase UbiE